MGATGLVQPVVSHGEAVRGVPPVYDQRANFSDIGSCVDVFAPGVEILAAIPVYGSPNLTSILSGTSMATPIVAGIALQVLGLHPDLSPDDVRRAIICLSLDGVIRDVDSFTHNRLVQGGRRLLARTAHAIIRSQKAPEGVVWDATECHRESANAAILQAEAQEQAEQQQAATAQQQQQPQQSGARKHREPEVLLA